MTGKALNAIGHVYSSKMKSRTKTLLTIFHLSIRKITDTQCSGSTDFLEIAALLGQRVS